VAVLLKRNSGGCRKPRRRIARATKFHSKAHDMLGHSVWNWIRVALPAPLILRWLLEFGGSLCTARIVRRLVLMATIILEYVGNLEGGRVPGISKDG
jgi:hypothetical protein